MIALSTLNCAYAQTTPPPENTAPDTEYSGMSGQERAMLLRAIQVAEHSKNITATEGNCLRNLIELGKGYPEMLKNYIYDYKRKGRSMDDFMRDVYNGKLPKK